MKDLIRAPNVSPMTEKDMMRTEIATNARPSIATWRSMGAGDQGETWLEMHLCVVPICVAATAVRNIKEVISSANHRKPKTPVTILLLLKTALTRIKNKAGVAENAIIKKDAET
jgi:hypothetical protein